MNKNLIVRYKVIPLLHSISPGQDSTRTQHGSLLDRKATAERTKGRESARNKELAEKVREALTRLQPSEIQTVPNRLRKHQTRNTSQRHIFSNSASLSALPEVTRAPQSYISSSSSTASTTRPTWCWPSASPSTSTRTI